MTCKLKSKMKMKVRHKMFSDKLKKMLGFKLVQTPVVNVEKVDSTKAKKPRKKKAGKKKAGKK